MLSGQALRALPKGGDVPAALGLFRRFQGQPQAARQVRPQPRQQLGAQCLYWQKASSAQHDVWVGHPQALPHST